MRNSVRACWTVCVVVAAGCNHSAERVVSTPDAGLADRPGALADLAAGDLAGSLREDLARAPGRDGGLPSQNSDGGLPPSSGDGWTWLNPQPTGEWLSSVWSDGTHAWAVGNDGAAIYADDGVSWLNGVSSTAQMLYGVWGAGTTVWAVGTGGTLLHSTDGGHHYAAVASGTTSDLYSVWGTGSTIFAVGDGGTILRVDNGKVSTLAPITNLDLRTVWGRSVTDVWTAGASSTVYHSSDGKTFAAAGSISTTPIAGLSGDATHVYAVGNGGWGGFASFDGTTWTSRDIDPGVADNLYGVWASSPTDIFAVGDRGVLDHSTDDFVTHGAIFTADEPNWLTSVWGQDNQLFVVGGSGTLDHSLDHGAHFTSGITGAHAFTTDDNLAVWGLDEQHLFVAGGNGHVWRSVDGGDHFTPLTTNVTGVLNAIAGKSDGSLVVSGGSYAVSNVLIHSTDFGDHFTQAPLSPVTTAMAFDGNTLYLVEGSSCTVYSSTDLGDHLTSIPVTGSCLGIEYLWAGGGTLLVGETNQPALYSSDGGAHWAVSQLPAGTTITTVWGENSSNLWGVGLFGAVLHSTDGGAHFSTVNVGLTDHLQAVSGRGSAQLFIAGSNHVVQSSDGGQSWQSLPDTTYINALWSSATHLYGVGTAGAVQRITR